MVWEAEFSEAGWIVPWTGERRRQVEQDAVKAALDTATWKGQLWFDPHKLHLFNPDSGAHLTR